MTTLPTVPADTFSKLQDLHVDGLAMVASICRVRCMVAPPGSRSCARWMSRRDKVIAEVERRGFQIWLYRTGTDRPDFYIWQKRS